MMKKFVYAIITAWILISCSIVVYNETILSCGAEILLKVMPYDPRDILRGDYVVLNYEINNLPPNIKSPANLQHYDAYVVLKENSDKTYSISSLSLQKPKNGVFLKGEIYGKNIYYNSISKYFVKEGEGRKIEKRLLKGGFVKVSVGRNGHARIKSIIFTDKSR